MTPSVTALLRCPICRSEGSTEQDGKIFACRGVKRHCFDLARSGYLNFSASSQSGAGDSKEAVRSRSAFLEAGYYRPLSDAVNAILGEVGARTVLDAGCGEGYYTNRMAEERVAIGVDLSRPAIDHAARVAKREGREAGFLVAGVFDLPIASGSMDAVTNLFAPCAEEEFLRVLKAGGHLVLVGAGERHLMGLKELLYEHPYLNPGREDLPQHMRLLRRERLQGSITVEGREMIASLFSMTPYYWRTSEADRAKLEACRVLTTEYDFDIFLYEKETSPL